MSAPLPYRRNPGHPGSMPRDAPSAPWSRSASARSAPPSYRCLPATSRHRERRRSACCRRGPYRPKTGASDPAVLRENVHPPAPRRQSPDHRLGRTRRQGREPAARGPLPPWGRGASILRPSELAPVWAGLRFRRANCGSRARHPVDSAVPSSGTTMTTRTRPEIGRWRASRRRHSCRAAGGQSCGREAEKRRRQRSRGWRGPADPRRPAPSEAGRIRRRRQRRP